MLTYSVVWDMFQHWRSKGIWYKGYRPNMDEEKLYHFFTNSFLSRYLFLQPDELENFSQLVLEKGEWPGKDETEKLMGMVLAENMQGLDFSDPYELKEEESYDDYIQRLGQSLFPKKDAEWYYRNALNIRLVYESGYCCAHCQKGCCPFGNRMLGVVSKQDGRLLAKRAGGMCSRFKGHSKIASLNQPVAEELPKQQGKYASDSIDYANGDYPQEALKGLNS